MSHLAKPDLNDSIRRHWSERIDGRAIESCLARKAGCDAAEQMAAVATFDQLHAGLAESTQQLADLARVNASSLVLDLGAGLGGAARCLAITRGCRVVAVDLTPSLVEQGRAVTERLDLSHLVEHVCGDVMAVRPASAVDVVWIQHVDMQIPDKVGLYRAAVSCLAPDGRIAWHDWLLGPAGLPTYPLMWSVDGSMSFLCDELAFRADIEAAGLGLTTLRLLKDETTTWFGKTLAAVRAALARETKDSPRRGRWLRLETELDNALSSIAADRLVPFFAVATHDTKTHP